MHRRILLSIMLAFGLCLSTIQAQDYLTILHLNDTHSNLAPGAPRDTEGNATVGGIARAASIIGMEKATNPDALVLHAGDAFMGDPVFNLSWGGTPPVQPELQMLLSMGIDAMAVGNHEYDMGCDLLKATLDASFATASFPLLCANLDMSAEPEEQLSSYITPRVILTRGNLKIGVFGLVTPEVALLRTATLLHGSDDYEAVLGLVAQQVTALQTENCDVIIFLSHLGYMLDLAAAQAVPGIHVIIGGHDHLALEQATEVVNMGGTTWVVQAGAFYRTMGKTTLKIDNGAVTLDNYTLIQLDESVAEFADLKTMCDGIYQTLNTATQGLLLTTVGAATGLLTEELWDCMSEGNLDTHVGNLCADAYAAVTSSDIGFQPGGSTAQPIYPGPIKVLDLCRTIGYGMNEENGLGFGLVTVDMTGAAIMAGLEVTLLFAEINDEMLIHPSASLKYSFDPQADSLARIHLLEVNGSPIDLGATYTVAFNSLLLGYFDFLSTMDPRITYSNPVHVQSTTMDGPLTEVEALVDYVTDLQSLSPDPLPGRVTSLVVNVMSPPSTPVSPVLAQNHPNPFSEATQIAFSIPATMHATVTIHDLVGREVAVLADRLFDRGTHQLAFHSISLPPGMYVCRLLTGNTQQSVRMMHVR